MRRLTLGVVCCWCALLVTIARCVPAVPLVDYHHAWQNFAEDWSSSEDYVNDNPVIEVDDNGVPVCPPAINHPEACYAKVCRSDIDCLGTKTERVCCYNGCVRTCMIKVKPPPFFDYDESANEHPAPDVGFSPIGRPVGAPTEVAEFQRPSIVLTLPGGCHLTQEQYDSYQKFQTAPGVRQCYCLAGDVFCQINSTAP